MKYKIMIVDDTEAEGNITELTVQKMLPSLKNQYSISVCDDPDTVSDFFTYDLYILDIHMQKEKDGFHLARLINNQNTSASIIFCTNYDDLVYEALEHEEHTFNIKTKTGYKKISISDILYIEASHNNCYLHTLREEEFDIPKSMSSFIKDLQEPSIMKINTSIAINISYVTHIDKSTLYIINSKKFEVSRRQLKKVREYFLREASWK